MQSTTNHQLQHQSAPTFQINQKYICGWAKLMRKSLNLFFQTEIDRTFKELGINTMSPEDLKDIMDGMVVSKQAPTHFAF